MTCYDFYNYTPRSNRPTAAFDAPQIPMPGLSADDVFGAGTLQAQNPPPPIRAFLESSAVTSLRASLENLCATNRDVFIERRRSMAFIGKLHAAVSLGRFFVDSRPHLRLPREVAARPHNQQFGEICERVSEYLTEEVLQNPFPRCHPALHRHHETDADSVLNALASGDLRSEVEELAHHPDRSQWEQSYWAVMQRVADAVELAVIELQYTSKHGDLTRHIDDGLRGGNDNVFKIVADSLGDLTKAPTFVARCLEAAARYQVYNLARNPGDALSMARHYLRAWGGRLGMDATELQNLVGQLRSGTDQSNAQVRSTVAQRMTAAEQRAAQEARRSIDHADLDNRLSKTLDAIGSIQALFVIADWMATSPVTDPNAPASRQARLDEIQAYVDRADAVANIGGRAFSLMRSAGANLTVNSARAAMATNVLKLVVARGPAIASGVITIFKGLDVFSVGYQSNSTRDMARGGLLVTAGSMLVIGTLVAGPVGAALAAGSIVVGLLASSLEDATYPAQQRMVGLLTEVLSEAHGQGHRVSNAERLDNLFATRGHSLDDVRPYRGQSASGLRTQVKQLEHMASGRDSTGGDMGDNAWMFWEINLHWLPDWNPRRLEQLQERAQHQLVNDGFARREIQTWVYIPRTLTSR